MNPIFFLNSEIEEWGEEEESWLGSIFIFISVSV
jgi:hypothetical protein